MVKEKGWKIGIIVGIILIVVTGSLMVLPFEAESETGNPISAAIEEMKVSENRMLDFIEQEKGELSSKIGQFSSP